ncbi:mechanosensitive ion channel domain-containing protein [Marinobacter zhejiangensis]|uniref:Potassium efflux system protein n=1 Tax=Marinobacter zhejiangensis TaxID=488535 RepID=A0A1I4LB00_9GAMM|nr:mechanosensitive ion channel domain-containing protein [Marinobacter zhejiangensis]SFL87817.1 potassium efflux system protein [Marinobacter zhejiangensis]
MSRRQGRGHDRGCSFSVGGRFTWLVWAFLLLSLPAWAQVQVNALDEEPQEQTPVVQAPIIEAPTESETPAPLPIEVPSESDSGIRQEIESLQGALNERRAALQQTRERQAFAQSLLTRLDDEFASLEQRLESAGLGLSENYANLLRRRLDRLGQQHLAKNLVPAIKEQLEAARVEQFQLEEFGAVLDPDEPVSDHLIDQRIQVLNRLRTLVNDHIEALTEYFHTITTLEQRLEAYQELVRRRLFWLPSMEPVGLDLFTGLFQAAKAIFEPAGLVELVKGVPQSVKARLPWFVLLALLLLGLAYTRRRVKKRLWEDSRLIGKVGQDRVGLTVSALLCSVTLALPGAILLLLAALAVAEGGQLGRGLANGLVDAAVLLFLLGVMSQIARPGGVAEQHFKWRPALLAAIRRGIPQLLVVLLPVSALLPISQGAAFAEYEDSFGRVAFTLASLALALFVHRLAAAHRTGTPARRDSKGLKFVHIIAVATPLLLALGSLAGYHYTALQLEGVLFISVCWLVFLTLLRYVGLRGLAVRERRLKLERLRAQRAKEQEKEALLEASGTSGEGRPISLDLPEMDLHDISAQSQALMAIVALAVAIGGLWILWAPIVPALHLFDEIALWSVSSGDTTMTVTLADLGLSALVAFITVYATRNLPGTLEVMVLSRMQLAPGTGYAITTVVTYLIVIVGVIASLNILGAEWSKLQWLVAALGVGLGFGLQEIVANFVSGIILLFERPIRVGDTVTIGGITGTVSRIRIRATTLVDWDRKEQIIPNKTFVTQDLTNWTLTDSITRVIVRVGVAYGSDVDQVRELLMGVATSNERVVAEPAPSVFCVGLGDSSINFEVRVFVHSMLDIMPLSHEIHATITRELAKAGIEIPFPQRDIHIRTDAGK